MGEFAELDGEHAPPSRHAYKGKPGYGDGKPWHQRRTTWTSRDGKVTPLKKLKDSHLENILAFLRRRAATARETASARSLLLSIARSFDGIPDDVIDDMSREASRDPEDVLAELPVYRALCREADRRALAAGYVPAPDTPVYNEHVQSRRVFDPDEDDLLRDLNDGGWGDGDAEYRR